jgi:uncharacterized membrane protein YphA (DoxX/SURF4 family)
MPATRRGFRYLIASASFFAIAGHFPRTANAHEKWFHIGPKYPLDFANLTQPLPASLIIGVLILTTAAACLWKKRGKRDFIPGPAELGASPERRAIFYSLVPVMLAVHVAVPLLASGMQGQLLSPNNDLSFHWKYLLGVTQTGIALSFFYGGLARAAAVILLFVWLVGIGVCGLESMLENAHYLGFASFFFLAGRGPHSVDRLLFRRFEPKPSMSRYALPTARFCLGISLTVVAFTEKLANPSLVEHFLVDNPLNFTSAIGIPMTDYQFAMCAGAVEFLVGLFVMFGLFPRVIILIAWLPFNMSLTVFNWVELVGHLPFYGLLAVLLVWPSKEEEQSLVIRGFHDDRFWLPTAK